MRITDTLPRELDRYPLTLGERGRGRWAVPIVLARRDPATDPERVRAIRIASKHDKDRTALVLLTAEHGRPDDLYLVGLTSRAVYTRGTWGRIEYLGGVGTARLLARGSGAHGIAGRIGGWTEELWAAAAPAIWRSRPEGGHKTVAYYKILLHDGRVVRVDEEDLPRMLLAADGDQDVAEAINSIIAAGEHRLPASITALMGTEE